MEVSVGIKVAARGLEWDVTEVEGLGAQQRVRLACSGGDLAGLEWDVLFPAEALSVLRTDPRAEEAGSLEAWRRYHIARLLERIPGAPAPPGRVAIEAYQRVPLLRALDMVRPRLLLADGVGLGKTIQAGLIAAELLVRATGASHPDRLPARPAAAPVGAGDAHPLRPALHPDRRSCRACESARREVWNSAAIRSMRPRYV